MAAGGPRVGGGRPRSPDSVRAKRAAKRGEVYVEQIPAQRGKVAPARKPESQPGSLKALPPAASQATVPKPTEPLEYMLAVMNDPSADPLRRDRMAVAAAPFLHSKIGESGKKQQRNEAAKTAGVGRFAPAAPPKLVVSNK